MVSVEVALPLERGVGQPPVVVALVAYLEVVAPAMALEVVAPAMALEGLVDHQLMPFSHTALARNLTVLADD